MFDKYFTESINGYVPDNLIYQRLNTNLKHPPIKSIFNVVSLFLDISGFTALTEKLALEDSEGIEKIKNILNEYFGKLIELIEFYEGDIIKFAGDAILVIWNQDIISEEIESILIKTIRLSFEIQKIFALNDSIVKLSAKIGIGYGEISFYTLGGFDNQFETLISGAGIVSCTKAETLANPNEIIIDLPKTSIDLSLELENIKDNFYKIKAINKINEMKNFNLLKYLIEKIEPEKINNIIWNYLPVSVKSKLEANQSYWLAELRNVSVIFLNIPCLSKEIDINIKQKIVFNIQKELKKYEGVINKISTDEKGASLLIVFGLPPFYHEDDSYRSVQFSLWLKNFFEEEQISFYLGITTGKVFCGEIGNETRQEYSIIGDSVNLSARLMNLAKETIICDITTYNNSQEKIEFNILESVSLKGKIGFFEIYSPIKEKGKDDIYEFDSDVFGRNLEKNILKEAINDLLKNKTNINILIQGEAGIGKSKLISYFINLAKKINILLYLVSGDSIEKNTPYHSLKSIFKDIFDIKELKDKIKIQDKIKLFFEDNNISIKFLPLLNIVLDLTFPENDITTHMLGEIRAFNINKLLSKIIFTKIEKKAFILVVEDVNLIDSFSWKVILTLKNQISSLMLVITSRVNKNESYNNVNKLISNKIQEEYFNIAKEEQTKILNLDFLQFEDIINLIKKRLNNENIAQNILKFIMDKSNGHPLFSEALIDSLLEKNLIKLDNNTYVFVNNNYEEIDIPNTIEGVLTEKIDRLTQSQQLILKISGIMGKSFKYKCLENIYPISDEKENLIFDLVQLEKQEIVSVESPFPELIYTFNHSLIYEVIYNMMLNEQRKIIHKNIALWYETNYIDNLDSFYPVILYHWLNSEDNLKIATYSIKIGEKYINNGSYKECIEYLDNSIKIIKENNLIEGFNFPYIQRLLGEAYYGLGDSYKSLEILEKAVSGFGFPIPNKKNENKELFKSILKQFFHRIGFYSKIVIDDSNSEKNIKLKDKKYKILESAKAYERLGQIYYLLSKKNISFYCSLFILNLMEEIGQEPQLVRAYTNLSLTFNYLKLNFLSNIYKNKALENIKNSNHLPSIAWFYQITGLISIGKGNLLEAEKYLTTAIEKYEKFGDIRHKNETLGLLSFTKYFLGKYDDSILLSNESLNMANKRGDKELEVRGILALFRNYLIIWKKDQLDFLYDKVLSFIDNENINELLRLQSIVNIAIFNLKTNNYRKCYECLIKINLLMKSFSVVSFLQTEIFFLLSEITLELIEHDFEKNKVIEISDEILIHFKKFSDVFFVSKPRFLIYSNMIDYFKKKTNSKKLFLALKIAEKNFMIFEQALACYYLEKYFNKSLANKSNILFESINAKLKR